MNNPFEREDGWYWFDETQWEYGPCPSRLVALYELVRYCAFYL